mgnify:CR=1 FL=1
MRCCISAFNCLIEIFNGWIELACLWSIKVYSEVKMSGQEREAVFSPLLFPPLFFTLLRRCPRHCSGF